MSLRPTKDRKLLLLLRLVRANSALQEATRSLQHNYVRFINTRTIYRIVNDPSPAFEQLQARRRIEWEIAQDHWANALERARVMRLRAAEPLRATLP